MAKFLNKAQIIQAQMTCFIEEEPNSDEICEYWLQRRKNKVLSIMHGVWKMCK